MLQTERGFDASDVLVAEISLSEVAYAAPEDHARWYDRLAAEAARLPGAGTAAVASAAPLTGVPNGRVELDGDLSRAASARYLLTGPGETADFEFTPQAPGDLRLETKTQLSGWIVPMVVRVR